MVNKQLSLGGSKGKWKGLQGGWVAALPSGSCGVSANLKSLTSVSHLQKNEARRSKGNNAGKIEGRRKKGILNMRWTNSTKRLLELSRASEYRHCGCCSSIESPGIGVRTNSRASNTQERAVSCTGACGSCLEGSRSHRSKCQEALWNFYFISWGGIQNLSNNQ